MIISEPILSFLYNVDYTYNAEGRAKAIGSEPMYWTLVEGPETMVVLSNGEVHWWANTLAAAQVTLRVSNAYGSDEQSFLLSLAEPVVQAIVLLLSMIYVFLTFLSDLLNAFLDPRIRVR